MVLPHVSLLLLNSYLFVYVCVRVCIGAVRLRAQFHQMKRYKVAWPQCIRFRQYKNINDLRAIAGSLAAN